MGYERKPKVFLLRFADPELEGLEVRVRSTNVRKLMDMAKLHDLADPTGEDLPKLDPLFDSFIGCLESWNLEADGQPVPMTKDALLDQELDFVMDLVSAWVEAAAGVAVPLGKQSSAGEQSLAASIPMETLSESRAS